MRILGTFLVQYDFHIPVRTQLVIAVFQLLVIGFVKESKAWKVFQAPLLLSMAVNIVIFVLLHRQFADMLGYHVKCQQTLLLQKLRNVTIDPAESDIVAAYGSDGVWDEHGPLAWYAYAPATMLVLLVGAGLSNRCASSSTVAAQLEKQ